MIRANDIQNELLHLVGWKQSFDTTDLRVSESLARSESGLYYQQAHPLLTLQNMACIAPDFRNTDYYAWDFETEYGIGNVVAYEEKLYKAVTRNTGSEPCAGSPDWEETNPFSEWLEDKTKASISKAISRFYNDKLAKGATKDLCEAKTLFDGTSRISDVVKNKRNLVGMEVVPIRAKGVVAKVSRIGLHFTKAGDYTLYLMHSSSEAPVKVFTLQKKLPNTMEWFSVDGFIMPYQSDTTDAGGSWYLCYEQSELPEGSEAIRHERDWSKEPCKSCSRVEYNSWLAWSKYVEFHPFLVNEEYVSKSDGRISLWDIDINRYTYDTNYGINLEISVTCDLTDFIIEQRSLFSDLISKQVAVDMLRELAYNPNVRTNRNTMNASRIDILYELDGDSSSMKKSGLGYQLDQAYKAVKFSTDGVYRVCLPCRNNGVKYRSV